MGGLSHLMDGGGIWEKTGKSGKGNISEKILLFAAYF